LTELHGAVDIRTREVVAGIDVSANAANRAIQRWRRKIDADLSGWKIARKPGAGIDI
jgi:hypothetical protein